MRASSQNVNTVFQPSYVDGLQPTYVRSILLCLLCILLCLLSILLCLRTYIDAGNKEAIERLPAKITYGLPAKTVFALFWS